MNVDDTIQRHCRFLAIITEFLTPELSTKIVYKKDQLTALIFPKDGMQLK